MFGFFKVQLSLLEKTKIDHPTLLTLCLCKTTVSLTFHSTDALEFSPLEILRRVGGWNEH